MYYLYPQYFILDLRFHFSNFFQIFNFYLNIINHHYNFFELFSFKTKFYFDFFNLITHFIIGFLCILNILIILLNFRLINYFLKLNLFIFNLNHHQKYC